MPEQNQAKLEEVRIEEEMKKAYIDYAMSVIVSRALPDVADGLKPVQRRILFSMHQMGLTSDKVTRKSARIVGDVLGKFHPHGDLPVYDALARMTQNFSLRYTLIDGQGNFGSIDGDPPAAMRYTEAKLSKLAEEMLSDIEKETVAFQANFDNSLKEPIVLPGKVPNLLINGASGIAVGMTTNIPPHNLSEVVDAIIEVIKNPNIEIDKLLEIVPAPDFPTAGFVYKDGITELYKTGRGAITARGKTNTDEERGRERIIVTEIPYQVNKSVLIEDIARLVQSKKLQDISDIRDESSKGKIRIVIELRRGANSKVVLNRLYNLTSLQTRFNGILLALVDGVPRILNLREIIEQFIKHRQVVVRKRTDFELRKAEDRQHIVSGLLIALKNLDNIITLLKKSQNVSEASQELVKKFNLSVKQAEAILDMRLARLTALEHKKLKDENEELTRKIEEFKRILGSEKEILEIIRKELLEIKKRYGDDRRTKILERMQAFSDRDLVQRENVVITLTSKGYIKRLPSNIYKEQRRGGKGITGTELTTGDFVQNIFTCNTHDYLLFFTNNGKAYALQCYQVPEGTRYAKGKALVNLLNLKDESVTTTISVKNFEGNLLLITKDGIIKKMSFKEFDKIRSSGIIAVTLPEGDALVEAMLTSDTEEILVGTAKGTAIRFSSKDLRSVGRNAYGVIAIRLEKDDYVVGAEILPSEKERLEKLTALTITEKGFGKRTQIAKYRRIKRGGKGITNIKLGPKTGNVVNILTCQDGDSIIVTTSKGMVIRTPAKSIRLAGRITQGVRIIRIAENDKVIGLSKAGEE